jgi:copper(I)-binding protein
MFFSVFLMACTGQKHEEAGLLFKSWYVVKPYVAGGGSVAYGKIKNVAGTTRVLKGADFSCANGAALHETVTTGDRVSMTALPEVSLAPGETISFEPGHKHIMLSGIKNAADSDCAAGFIFDSGKVLFQIPVKSREK